MKFSDEFPQYLSVFDQFLHKISQPSEVVKVIASDEVSEVLEECEELGE